MDAALKQNINLKIEVQQRSMETKKLKKLNQERELEEKLEERDRELKELRRRHSGQDVDDEAFREIEARNVELEEQVDGAKGIIEENLEEIERLKEIIERRGTPRFPRVPAARVGGRGRNEG
ncbi:hypothetical protein DXG01_015167 [Tephrocybe rancida]|nr:hypothetical protein DXG01_015167 [Tephrocybe rancida]